MNLPEIRIAMDARGQINVSGPLQDKILCLGLIEAGKFAVMAAQAPPAIIPANGQIPIRAMPPPHRD